MTEREVLDLANKRHLLLTCVSLVTADGETHTCRYARIEEGKEIAFVGLGDEPPILLSEVIDIDFLLD